MLKQKLKIFPCIVFLAIIGWPDIYSKNNSENPSKHYRDLQDWRDRLEKEKEEEKKETWSNTFHIGSKQVVDQAIKVVIAGIIGGLIAYPLGTTPKEKNIIAATTFFISIVTLNWKFHSPIQRRIIRKGLRKEMIKEISNQIEKVEKTK